MGEMAQVLDIASDGITVLYAHYDSLPSQILGTVQVGRRARYKHRFGEAVSCRPLIDVGHHRLNLVQRAFGLLEGGRVPLVGARPLRQISYHDRGIQMALGHLVHIHEDARVALVKPNLLVEEHGCVAMAV